MTERSGLTARGSGFVCVGLACALLSICGLATLGEAQTARLRVSEPENSFSLLAAQARGAGSPLGDLRTRRMGPTDVELRLWYNAGLAGTTGLILRRQHQRWTAWFARVHSCSMWIPDAVADTITRTSVARYEAQLRRRCVDPTRSDGGGRLIQIDTLALVPLPATHNYARLWRDVEAAGIWTLPPMVPRAGHTMDGHSYQLEVRQGTRYRASHIERRMETEADRRIQRIHSLLHARLGPLP